MLEFVLLENFLPHLSVLGEHPVQYHKDVTLDGERKHVKKGQPWVGLDHVVDNRAGMGKGFQCEGWLVDARH